jgi:hypothetical protein
VFEDGLFTNDGHVTLLESPDVEVTEESFVSIPGLGADA